MDPTPKKNKWPAMPRDLTGLADGLGVGLAPLDVHRVHPDWGEVGWGVLGRTAALPYIRILTHTHTQHNGPIPVHTLNRNGQSNQSTRRLNPGAAQPPTPPTHRLSKWRELLKASMMGSVAPEKRPPHSFLVDGAAAL